MGISLTFARLSPSGGQVGYALLTRAPVDAHQKQAFDVVSPPVSPLALVVLVEEVRHLTLEPVFVFYLII